MVWMIQLWAGFLCIIAAERYLHFKDGKWNAMKVNETNLLKSGFSSIDIQKIKNNAENYGDSIGDTIQDLANRFRIVLWIFLGCMVIFIYTILSSSQVYIISTGIGLLITMLIVIFVQPPVLSYKSWRYCRMHRTNDDLDQ